MSHNWQTRDLAARLRTQSVLAKDVKVGDIIVDDCAVWEVAKITRKHGFTLADEDRNSVSMPGNSRVEIIERSSLRTR